MAEIVRPVRCITCKFLAELSPEDRAEWESELKLGTITNEAVARVMNKLGITIMEGAVRTHRLKHQ